MSKTDFARKMAGMAFHAEMHAAKMLGDAARAVDSAFDVHDETFNAVLDPERAAVLTRFRPIGATR